MLIPQTIQGLQFHNDAIVTDKIHTKRLVQCMSFVFNAQHFLPLIRYAAKSELYF